MSNIFTKTTETVEKDESESMPQPRLYLDFAIGIPPDGYKSLLDGYYYHYDFELSKETDPLYKRIFNAAIGCKDIDEVVEKVAKDVGILVPYGGDKKVYLKQKVTYALHSRTIELKNQAEIVVHQTPISILFPPPGPVGQNLFGPSIGLNTVPLTVAPPPIPPDVVHIYIVGAPGVGKKALKYLIENQIDLVDTFMSQAFKGVSEPVTLGSDAVFTPNVPIPVVLFHLEEEPTFSDLAACNIVIYAYSVCQAGSFDFVFSKMLANNQLHHSNSEILVVGNKLDMSYWRQYKPGEVENKITNGYAGSVSYVELSCLSLLNFNILNEFIVSKIFCVNYSALNYALSICRVDPDSATVANMDEVNRNIKAYGGIQFNVPYSYDYDGSDHDDGDYDDDDVDSYDEEDADMTFGIEAEEFEEREVGVEDRREINKKMDKVRKYTSDVVPPPLPPPMPSSGGGVPLIVRGAPPLPPPAPPSGGGVPLIVLGAPPLPPPEPVFGRAAELADGIAVPAAPLRKKSAVLLRDTVETKKNIAHSSVKAKKVAMSKPAVPPQQQVLGSVSASSVTAPIAPVRSTSSIPIANRQILRRSTAEMEEESVSPVEDYFESGLQVMYDVSSESDILDDHIIAESAAHIPMSKEKLYTIEPNVEDGLDVEIKAHPLEVDALERDEEPMQKRARPVQKALPTCHCMLDIIRVTKSCLTQVYNVLTGGDNKLFDNVMADTENAFQTLAKLLVFIMGIQENLVNIVSYSVSYCVTLLSSIALILPSFFTLLIVRVNKIEKESKDFGIRQEKVRDEKVEESFVRWVRIILRSLPMTFYITVVPWLLVYFSFPHSNKHLVVGGLVGFISGVIVLQIFGTVRSYYSWVEKKDEVGIKTVPPLFDEVDETFIGIFRRKDADGNVKRKQVPRAYPYIPNKFAFTSPSNLMTLASLALEFFQMATFPLQNNPYDTGSVVVDDDASSVNTDTSASTDWWGAKIYDVVYINWVISNLQYISMWVTIALVFLLLLVFTHQFVYELYKYGLLLRDRKDKDVAKDQFFFSFTGSVVYGHGNPNNISDTKKTLISGLTDGLFLVISMRLLDIISCDYTDPSAPTLYTDPSIVCWSSPRHGPLAALALNCYAFYIPLSIMIAPMLLEAGGSAGGVGYSKIYLMFVNVVKSVMLLVGALGPKTVQTVVVSAILTSFCLGAVTVGWFHSTDPSTFSNLSVDLEPCNIAFINLFKAASYTASVVSAIIIIVAHEMGPERFSQARLLPTLIVFWIAILVVFWFIHYNWRQNYGKRYDCIEKMAMYPYAWRDYMSKKRSLRLNILNQLQGLETPKGGSVKEFQAPPLELPVDDEVEPAAIVLYQGIYLKNKLNTNYGSHCHKLMQIQKIDT